MPSLVAFRRRYLASAATAAALALLSVPGAQAANECGPLSPTTGAVACAPGSYGAGISYSSQAVPPASTTNVDVQLQGGSVGGTGVSVSTSSGGAGQVDFNGATAVETNAGGANGVTVSASGDATVTGGAGATVTTHGGSADGFSLSSLAAAVRNVTFNFLGTTVTHGDNSAGVAASGVDNFTSNGVGKVTTSGANSDGIAVGVRSGGPNKTVTIVTPDQIQTSGASSDAISVSASAGTTTAVDLKSTGDLTTSGAGSHGVGVSIGGGTIAIDAANVSTTGATSNAIDLNVLESGSITVRSLGTISTTALDSKGVAAKATQGNVSVDATNATIKTGGTGIDITATSGDATINASGVTVVTKGDGATGLSAAAGTGNAVISGADAATAAIVSVTTSGANATGILAKAGTPTQGAIVNVGGSVTTSGDNANGLQAEATNGSATATASSATVVTKGANSVGVLAKTGTGDAAAIGTGATITTSGVGAHALQAQVTGNGIATASSVNNTITTSGKGSNGMFAANSGTGSAVANVTGGSIATSGDQAHAIQVTTGNGAGTVDVSGTAISTKGAGANGVNLLAAGGDGILSLGGSVDTSGAGAAAVRVFSTGGAAAANTKPGDGPVVKTTGAGSNGFDVQSATGDASVSLVNGSSVQTDGAGSEGVIVRAVKSALATIGGLITSNGDNSKALDVRSSGTGSDDATANVNAVVKATGANSTAVSVSTNAGTSTANINADVFATGAGGIGVELLSTTGKGVATLAGNVTAVGAGVHLAAAGGNTLSVGKGFTLTGGTVGAVHVDAGESSITNDGTMQSTSGRLVLGDGAAKTVTVNNNALMNGFMTFATNDSVINNAAGGIWTASATSNFGSGTSIVNNAGVIRTDPAAAGSANVTFSKLGTLNNGATGLITMANGKAGDRITTTGNYSGQSGSRLGIDAFLGGPGSKADAFAIGGNALGSTAIVVNDLNSGPGRYNPTGIVVVTVGGSNTPSSFSLAGGPIDKGLWQYDLSRISNGTFALITAPSGEVMSASSLVPQARRYWQAGQDGFDDHRAAIRGMVTGAAPPVPAAPQNSVTLGYAAPDTNPFDAVFNMTGKNSFTTASTGALWGQVIHQQITDRKNSTFNSGSAAYAYDTTTDQSLTRFIGGIDLGTELRANSALSFGIYGGYGTSDGTMNTSATGGIKSGLSSLALRGSSIGGYAQYLTGPWWVGVSGLYDMLDADYHINRVGFSDKIKGNVWGAQADAGWTVRWSYGTVEPYAALTWLSTDYGTVDTPWGQFAFGTQSGLDGKIGVRSRTPFWHGDGWIASVLADGAFAHTFTGKSIATFDGFALPTMTATSWGNVGGGVEVATQDGRISGYAKADWLASSGLSGYNVLGGMHYRW